MNSDRVNVFPGRTIRLVLRSGINEEAVMWRLVNVRRANSLIFAVFEAQTELARRLRMALSMNNQIRCLFAAFPLIILCLAAGGCAPVRFENEVGLSSVPAGLRAELPTGMRRTNRGWEDASLWFASEDFQPRSLDWWIEHHQQREPRWLRATLERVRGIPPLMFAVIQITAIAGIVHASQVRKSNKDEETRTSSTG